MPKTLTLPKGWPADVIAKYIIEPEYSKVISKETLSQLNNAPANVEYLPAPSLPSPLVKITPIQDPSHPAHGQYGLFSTQNLQPDSFILFYLGFTHTKEDTDPTSDYDLSLDRELGIGVDATKSGNEARFINDYRGVAEAPNAEFRDCWVKTSQGPQKRVAVFVLSAGKSKKRSKGIGKGQEILVSYGKGFWHERRTDEST